MNDIYSGPASIHAVNAMMAHKETLAERTFHRETSQIFKRPKKMFKKSLGLEAALFKCALFRAAIGPRVTFTDYVSVPSHPNAEVMFRGEELRQDDQRVLMMLAESQTGRDLRQGVSFKPRSFARDVLRWPDNGDSVERLKASISRLKSASIKVWYHYGNDKAWFGEYSFVSSYEFGCRYEECAVYLAPQFLSLFETREQTLTFFVGADRLARGDNFGSWLFGYMAADACLTDISTVTLREISGQAGYEQKEFNRRLKRELNKLIADRVMLASYQMAGKILKLKLLPRAKE